GLVVGTRPRFNAEIRHIFLDSGTMHILVASGSNVAFVMAFWFFICRLLFRLPRRWCLLSSLPLIGGYVVVAGADPPICRAGLMATVGIVSYLLAREDRPYHALALAAWVILIIEPRALFD